jgi:hypothetical protein
MNTLRLAFAIVALSMVGLSTPARAGCEDLGCMRVDWTDLTRAADGQPSGAKLHGAMAWQASQDWASHPVAGKTNGVIQVACAAPGPGCADRLTSLLAAKDGRTPAVFHGRFFGLERPPFVYPEGADTQPMTEEWPTTSPQQADSNVCREAFALPAAGTPPSLPPSLPPAAPMTSGGGCAIGGGGTGAFGAALVGLALAIWRRRRPRPDASR